MKVICSILLLAFIFMQNHDISEAFGYRMVGRMVGSMGLEKPVTKRIEILAAKMKGAAEEFLGRKFEMFKATSFAIQIVGGTNFFIKVKVGKHEYVHIRVYQPLPYTRKGPSLAKAVDKKTENGSLEYF
eukprot:Seg1903.2 transcript_id=Seg1903.2/GoldUCD/mRNA.D3Y31 product=Cystatin-B protein_id=Seg1903.2/GoldUCD/D3Y31